MYNLHMYRQIRIILILMVIVLAAGCTTYRPATISGKTSEPGVDNAQVQGAHIGDNVRITLVDGSVYSGQVLEISEKELVVGKTGNLGYEENVIPLSNIEELEVEGLGEPLDFVAGSIGILFIMFMALLIFVGESIELN